MDEDQNKKSFDEMCAFYRRKKLNKKHFKNALVAAWDGHMKRRPDWALDDDSPDVSDENSPS